MGRKPLDLTGYENDGVRVVPGTAAKRGTCFTWEVECKHCGKRKRMTAHHVRKARSCGCQRGGRHSGNPRKHTPEQLTVLLQGCGSVVALARHLDVSKARAYQLLNQARVPFRRDPEQKRKDRQEKQQRWHEQRRARLRLEGRCPGCGGATKPGLSRCEGCLASARSADLRKRERAKALGLCCRCHKQPAAQGVTFCQKCREDNGQYIRRLYQVRKFIGQCVHFGCPDPAETGQVHCPRHRQKRPQGG